MGVYLVFHITVPFSFLHNATSDNHTFSISTAVWENQRVWLSVQWKLLSDCLPTICQNTKLEGYEQLYAILLLMQYLHQGIALWEMQNEAISSHWIRTLWLILTATSKKKKSEQALASVDSSQVSKIGPRMLHTGTSQATILLKFSCWWDSCFPFCNFTFVQMRIIPCREMVQSSHQTILDQGFQKVVFLPLLGKNRIYGRIQIYKIPTSQYELKYFIWTALCASLFTEGPVTFLNYFL